MEPEFTGSRNQVLGEWTTPPLPREMVFSEESLLSVICYCVLFVIAACGNLTVFITLYRNRHRKSRVNLFIMHLSIADLIITFVVLPLEVTWHVTVSWNAGDAMCRIMMFFRAFGFYLSSFILIAISLDRYFAIVHPLSLNDADKRSKLMLIFSWAFSVTASIPQSIIFHVEHNPDYPWFAQCITFNFFPSPAHELAYNMFNMITVYALPLGVIIVSYSLILREMTKKTRESKEDVKAPESINQNERLRRSNVGQIQRARIRTLRLTIMMVLVFILCWTPYFVMSLWWWFDKKTAEKVDPRIQKGLFLFAVSNSCMDPIVYGLFSLNLKHEFQRCCCCLKKPHNSTYYEMVTASAMLQASTNHQKSPMNANRPNYARTSDGSDRYLPEDQRRILQTYASKKKDGGNAASSGNKSPPHTNGHISILGQNGDAGLSYMKRSDSAEFLCPASNHVSSSISRSEKVARL